MEKHQELIAGLIEATDTATGISFKTQTAWLKLILVTVVSLLGGWGYISYAEGISPDKLIISKHWIELTRQNNEWVYLIPCRDLRELQTVDIIEDNSGKALIWNNGLDQQRHAIKQIRKQADSLIFTTILLFDTTATVDFTFTVVDKGKNIGRWTGEGVSCTYIPVQDTVKYKRIVQPCDYVCYKCDISKVLVVNENLNNLTLTMVSQFLYTFDSACVNNAEYSEWSNEILFKLIDEAPGIFFQVIEMEINDDSAILNEIQNPVCDFDFQKIYDKIKTSTANADVKAKYLKALIIAGEKTRQKLSEEIIY